MGNTLNSHVGPAYAATGSAPGYDQTTDEHNSERVVQASGKYADTTKRGNVYCGGASGLTPAVALNATAVPLALYNPVGSGKRLKIMKVAVAQDATGTLGTGALWHMAGTINGPTGSQGNTVPTGTGITPTNMDIGAANASVASLLKSATVVAGQALYPFIQEAESVGGTTTSGSCVTCYEDVDGNIVLEPGGLWYLGGKGAAGSSPLIEAGIVWEEEPLAS